MKKTKKDELENYRKLLDDTLKKLIKIHDVKDGKKNLLFAALGICMIGLGGVAIVLSTSVGRNADGSLSVFNVLVIFLGVSLAFIGYILSHKGLKGTWL